MFTCLNLRTKSRTMDNVSEKLSETQTEISENITPLSGEELIDANSQKLSENEHSKISLESDEIRRRKSNRSERSESYRKDRKILEVVEEKPAFHEYTGLRLVMCALVGMCNKPWKILIYLKHVNSIMINFKYAFKFQ